MRATERLLAELRPHIADERVLEAIAAVPRHAFVPPARAAQAWENSALPIGCGQTISQPYVVARMCELLELQGNERVLDVGTGSGYHAAVLGRLAAHVYSIERHPELAAIAAAALRAAGVENVTCVVGDGTRGLPGHAPYDAINVAAAIPQAPGALIEELAPGGRLVAPLGDSEQRLTVLRRTPAGIERGDRERVRFVPLVPGPPDA